MKEQEIYQKIGQILLSCRPENALKLIVRVELFPENDGGKYEFDYLDKSGEIDWFDPDGRAIGDLTDTLVELRKIFIINNMTNKMPIWSKCEITVDVPKEKINVRVQYDN